ncbi:MAG: DUF2798 domain-containing protein [Methylotenera sp.]
MKISELQRKLLFAFIMSANTALITTGIVVYKQAKSHEHAIAQLIAQWLSAFITVWPIVFMVILLIAPLVNRILDQLFVLNKN